MYRDFHKVEHTTPPLEPIKVDIADPEVRARSREFLGAIRKQREGQTRRQKLDLGKLSDDQLNKVEALIEANKSNVDERGEALLESIANPPKPKAAKKPGRRVTKATPKNETPSQPAPPVVEPPPERPRVSEPGQQLPYPPPAGGGILGMKF